MIILPVFSSSTAFNYEIPLDGRTFDLAFVYSDRLDSWALSIKSATGESLADGIPLVLGVDLLDWRPDRNMSLPQGALVVITLDKTQTDPGKNSFDLGHRLVYYSPGEVPEMPRPDLVIYEAV